MKRISSKVLASLLALALVGSAASAVASTQLDAQPQCGDDKKGDTKDDKKGDTKDDKKGETKPKPPARH